MESDSAKTEIFEPKSVPKKRSIKLIFLATVVIIVVLAGVLAYVLFFPHLSLFD